MKLSPSVRDETHPSFSVPHAHRLVFTQCSSDTFNASGYYNRVVNTVSALQPQGLFSVNNSTMRRPTETCFYSNRKTTVVRKNNELSDPIKIAKAALPTACVIVAGPAISCFPPGSLAPILAILATSFASTYLYMKAIGIAVILIQGCGLSGLEGRMLALLSFLSFSSTFDKLGGPPHFSHKGLLLVTRIIQSEFAGAVLSTCSGLLASLQAMTFAVYGSCSNILILVSQSFSTSWIKMLPLETPASLLELLAQNPHGLYSMESYEDYDGNSLNPRHNTPSNMSQEADEKYQPTNVINEASLEDLLANCETIREHEAQKGSYSNDMGRGNQTLIDQVIRLIDECDGILSSEQWDEIIAALD